MFDEPGQFHYPKGTMQLSRKGWIGVVIAVVVIALAVYGWWVFLGPGSNPYKGLRTHSDIQMTDEIRALI